MKRTTLHRAVFQVHLWAGLSLGLYAFLIGATGSVLMFRDEIVQRIAPVPRLYPAPAQANLQRMLEGIESQSAGWTVWSIEAPRAPDAPWSSYLLHRGKGRSVFADADGNIIAERRLEGTWLGLFEQFHSNLLIRNGGRSFNGAAGLALAALALSGVYLWWPAPGQWSGAFRMVRTTNWKGIVYDLHRVGGAVTLVFTLMFCITGAYFAWPGTYRKLVAAVLPMKPKAAAARIPAQRRRLSLDVLLTAARGAVPGGEFVRVVGPQEQRAPVRVVFRHGAAEENYKTSQVSLDPATARVLDVDSYADRKAGDDVVSFIGRLHAGRFGGLVVKLLWAAAGLSLPLLFLTGFAIWCNRAVAPRLRKRLQSAATEAPVRESCS